MKKIILLAFCIGIILNSQAQKRESSSSNYENAVKLNISSLLFSHINLQYERVLGKHLTACAAIRYRPKFPINIDDAVFSQNGQSNPNDVSFGTFKFSSLAITPEIRYYTKEAMRGFYIAPYLRYRNTPFETAFTFINDLGQSQSELISGNLNALMGGAMIGTNIFLSDRMNLDLFIVGGHGGLNTFGLDWNSSNTLSQSEMNDIEQGLADIKEDLQGTLNFDYSVNANGYNIDTRLAAFGFRGLGLNLVYKF